MGHESQFVSCIVVFTLSLQFDNVGLIELQLQIISNNILFFERCLYILVLFSANPRRWQSRAGVRFSPPFVCVSVCLFFGTISQKPMQPGSPNLTHKWSRMSLGNPFILGSKGRGHGSQNIAGVGLCTCVSAGC